MESAQDNTNTVIVSMLATLIEQNNTLRKDMQREFAAVRQEMATEFAKVRTEMSDGFARQDALHEATQEGISLVMAAEEADRRRLEDTHGARLTKIEKHLKFA